MRSRRHVRRPPDLTSMFDVLFIVIFAALIRAAAAEHAAAHPPEPPRPAAPVIPPSVAELRQRALAELNKELAGRTPLVVRINKDARIEAIEVGGRRIALDVPLLEQSRNPNAVETYLGDRSADLRVCKIAATQLGDAARGDAALSQYLVIIAPAVALLDLQHALFDGLTADVVRCFTELRGVATLVDPAPPAATPGGVP